MGFFVHLYRGNGFCPRGGGGSPRGVMSVSSREGRGGRCVHAGYEITRIGKPC